VDEDIREDLKDLSKHVQSIGRIIGSETSGITNLTAMSNCLRDAKQTLDAYIKIQQERNSNEF
jgi:hypothetical protein